MACAKRRSRYDTSATVNSGGAGVLTQSYGYDSLGNIVSRSDLGSYSYGAVNSRPHALTQLVLNGGGRRSYAYDANGNLTGETQYDAANTVIASKGRSEVYTSFNLPQALGAPGISLAFVYGPEHQRVKQIAPAATTIYLHPDNSGGLFYEKDLKPDGGIEHRHFITAGGSVVAIVKQSGSGISVVYLHRDQLGSTTAVTDEAGAVLERLAYEPFGKRRTPAGMTDPNNTLTGVNTDRGYTNHEHLDELGLIHMNGRIYDPALGRFMSADPFIQAPGNLQSYNRYAYVVNSPFLYTDPSGFSWWTNFRDKWARPIAAIVVAVYAPQISAYIGWTGGVTASGAAIAGGGSAALGMSGAVASGMLGGAMSGAIAGGNLKSAVIGGVAGGAFGYVGDIAPSGMTNVAGHAAVGCASSSLAGGSCGSGAMAAAAGSAWSNYGVEFNSFGANVIAHAVVGGTASMLGGGKFANGAVTGAFGYLFNECAHTRNCGIGGGYDRSDVPLLTRMKEGISDFFASWAEPHMVQTFQTMEMMGSMPTPIGGMSAASRVLSVTELTEGQAANLARFTSKLPSANTGVTITAAESGGVVFSSNVPGRVPGSYAVYQKSIDSLGNTTGYIKTTVDPAGNIVHIKNKF